MKTLRIISIILLALVPAVFIFAEQKFTSLRAPDLQTSKIIGVVLDANNARIIGALIKIENAQVRRKLQSDGEGNFEVALPAGEYQITVEKEGFRRFELSPLRVNAKVCELINVHMEVAEPRGLLKVK